MWVSWCVPRTGTGTHRGDTAGECGGESEVEPGGLLLAPVRAFGGFPVRAGKAPSMRTWGVGDIGRARSSHGSDLPGKACPGSEGRGGVRGGPIRRWLKVVP